MRVVNARYSRDMRAFRLAVWMLSYGARTNTVCLWTDLSGDRVRNLADAHIREGVHRPQRRRGPSPSQITNVLTNPSLRSEVAAIASIGYLHGLIPVEPTANARTQFPNVARGEQLCAIFELFRGVLPHARLSLEQFSLVVIELAAGGQWGSERCTRCPSLLVVDRYALNRRPICEDCQYELRADGAGSLLANMSDIAVAEAHEPSRGEQLRLFR
jgi:hypothetical protein